MLNADRSYNLSAIVKLAHKGARSSRVRFNEWQRVPSYREAFRAALTSAWAQAKRERAAVMRSPEQVAHDAERASRLFEASMIDNTHRMFAAVSQIEARSFELRA